MRILHVVPTYLPATRYGGPIFAVHGLAKALVRRGHEVEVLTTNRDGDGVSDVPIGSFVEVDGVRVKYFTSFVPRLYWAPAMARALPTAVQNADVVHAHSVFLWPTLAAARAARGAMKPYLISPRGMLVPELIAAKSRFVKRLWIETFERRNLAHASAVHFTSTVERDDASRLSFKINRTLVVPNGVDVLPLAQVDRVDNRVLYLGRISWKKRIDRLIGALAMAPAATLVIVGNDDEGLTPALQELAGRLGVASRIEWAGAVSGNAKQELLASSSLLALASDSENFGNVALEALVQETPVLLSSGVGVAAMISEAGAGTTVLPSTEAFASALNALLADRLRLRSMGRTGRQLVEARFSWDHVAAEMETAYRALIA